MYKIILENSTIKRFKKCIFRTEAMSDLIYLLDTLVDVYGKILVTGVYQDVAPITEAEKEIYKSIDFKPSEFQSEIGCNKLLTVQKRLVGFN